MENHLHRSICICVKTYFYLPCLNSPPFSFEHSPALQDKNRLSSLTFILLSHSIFFSLILVSKVNNTNFPLHSFNIPFLFLSAFFQISQRSAMTLHSISDSHKFISYNGTGKFSIPSPSQ